MRKHEAYARNLGSVTWPGAAHTSHHHGVLILVMQPSVCCRCADMLMVMLVFAAESLHWAVFVFAIILVHVAWVNICARPVSGRSLH